MALSDKNIVITPNIGSSSDPKIVFSGADASTSAQNITLQVYPTNNGTLSFEGSSGQLFSISNTMSGTIYSVNDISGVPSIEVLDTGNVKLAQYSGNVGIGVASPSSKFEVSDTTSYAAKFSKSGSSVNLYSYVDNGGSGISNANPYTGGALLYLNSSTFTFYSAGGSVASINSAGTVAASDFSASSDLRLKENIKPIDHALSKILQLEGKNFNMKSTGDLKIGLIAQQVEPIIPEVVQTDSNTGLKSITYANLVALLIEGMKEQHNELTTLKAQVTVLMEKLNDFTK